MPIIDDVCGLVTREVKYGENSRILTVLAKDFGRISVLAGRSRTNRSGVLTATQLFAYSQFTLFKGRDNSLLKLNEAEVIRPFSGIRLSLDKMAYASYFCDITNYICREGVEENEQLRLSLNILHVLEQSRGGAEDFKTEAVFLLRTLLGAGLAPSFDGCGVCGARSNISRFVPSEGVFLCSECAEKQFFGGATEVNDNLFSAASYIVNAESSKILGFNLGEKSLEYLAYICEEFTRYRLEKDFGTLDYLKKVRAL